MLSFSPTQGHLENFGLELLLFLLTATCTHLVMSCSQTLLHYWLGHRRLGGALYRNHINFHHAYYARGHLASATYRGAEGNNTPFFLIPTVLIGGGLFFALPFGLFVVMALVSAASFYAHVFLDKEYHVEEFRTRTFRLVQAQAAAPLRPSSACEQQLRGDRLLLGQADRNLPKL